MAHQAQLVQPRRQHLVQVPVQLKEEALAQLRAPHTTPPQPSHPRNQASSYFGTGQSGLARPSLASQCERPDHQITMTGARADSVEQCHACKICKASAYPSE